MRVVTLGASAFAAVAIAAAVVSWLQSDSRTESTSLLFGWAGELNLPGVSEIVDLQTGGVKAMAVDGQDMWVMEALHHLLRRVDTVSGTTEQTYPIDDYAEGVVVGGGYVWLMSYDHDGRVLRFDPVGGAVDTSVPIEAPPTGATWFGGSLWVSNEGGDLYRISPTGEVLAVMRGQLKGEALGFLWVNDPETGLIASLSADGTLGEMVIPTRSGLETADGWGVRQVAGVNGHVWLMDGMYPYGTNLSVFDPTTGDLRSFGGYTFGLHSLIEFDGFLWLTSHTDHLLIRVDPVTGKVNRYPMPGKAGSLVVADGSLWVALFHPGVLVRIDPGAELLESPPVVVDDWNRYPHRFLCIGPEGSSAPTVILEPYNWIDYGSLSVVQAKIANAGYLACVNGYVEGEASPQQRADELEEALLEANLAGPFVLVANGDGVHTTRLFAEGRTDVAGVVLVDPMPVGYSAFLDHELGGGGHPPFADLDSGISETLEFRSVPLVVIGQDPHAVFLSPEAVDGLGLAQASEMNDYWQAGLAFYAGLSSNSRSVQASGTGMHMLVWDSDDLVTDEVLSLLDQIG
jgi:streptogramin lyase